MPPRDFFCFAASAGVLVCGTPVFVARTGAGAVRKTGAVGSYLYHPRRPAFRLTLTRSAALAALMLALRSLNARVLRAFLRRFKYTAQSRSHAGCALAGDPLALSVCGPRR